MSNGEQIRFGDATFDPGTGEITTPTATRRLARQPAMVLYTLASRPGEVVSRSELQAAVWGPETHVDYDQNLNYCIREIRRALGDSPTEHRFIETLPKRGYRWVAPTVVALPAAEPAVGRSHGSLAALLGAALIGGIVVGHEISVSTAHARAVDWAHRVLDIPAHSCPIGRAR